MYIMKPHYRFLKPISKRNIGENKTMANRFNINSLVTETTTGKTYLITDLQPNTNAYFAKEINTNNIAASIDAQPLYIYEDDLIPYADNPDTGYMIMHIPSCTYYNGMNQFKKGIRNGKVYHKLNCMLETFHYYFEKNAKRNPKYIDLNKSNYGICEITLKVTNTSIITSSNQ